MINNIVQNKLLRRAEVLERTGLSNSTLYYFINKGSFPSPYKIGERIVAWKEDEIDEWINNLSHSIKKEDNNAL